MYYSLRCHGTSGDFSLGSVRIRVCELASTTVLASRNMVLAAPPLVHQRSGVRRSTNCRTLDKVLERRSKTDTEIPLCQERDSRSGRNVRSNGVCVHPHPLGNGSARQGHVESEHRHSSEARGSLSGSLCVGCSGDHLAHCCV